jgi:hypothetical protein
MVCLTECSSDHSSFIEEVEKKFNYFGVAFDVFVKTLGKVDGGFTTQFPVTDPSLVSFRNTYWDEDVSDGSRKVEALLKTFAVSSI